MKRQNKWARVGRMARWQRRCSYVVLAACFASGLVWFVLLDLVGWQPPQVVVWWILHGITGFIALIAIGGALPQHVVVAWRHGRNRAVGLATAIVLGLASASALLLLYGPEPSHDAAHWIHVGVGLAAMLVFVVHVITGRNSPGHHPVAAPGRG